MNLINYRIYRTDLYYRKNFIIYSVGTLEEAHDRLEKAYRACDEECDLMIVDIDDNVIEFKYSKKSLHLIDEHARSSGELKRLCHKCKKCHIISKNPCPEDLTKIKD